METEEILDDLKEELANKKDKIQFYLNGYKDACNDDESKGDVDYEYERGRKDGIKEALSDVREKIDEVKEDE